MYTRPPEAHGRDTLPQPPSRLPPPVRFLVIVLMMVFGEYEVMSEAVMSVFKDFSHVATPGRDPPGYQFPMLTQSCILYFVVVAGLS